MTCIKDPGSEPRFVESGQFSTQFDLYKVKKATPMAKGDTEPCMKTAEMPRKDLPGS